MPIAPAGCSTARYLPAAIAASFVATLAACGGGGTATAPTPAPSPPPPLPQVDVSHVAAADPGSALPAGWDHGAFMEIFVRSYADSDGDGKGDLRGLIARLPYLKSLGVRGIWLMPVTASEDHDHGYAVQDYRAIESDYGTLADFDELVRQAHAAGIGVIVDYVMNHSAATHALFVHSASSPSDPYRNWYVWQNPAPAGWSVFGGNPWRSTANGAYYAPFWDQMPDWNLTSSDVVAYHQDNQRFWLNRGADGFRFDAVGNLVENGPDGVPGGANGWLDQPQDYTLMGQMQSLAAGYQRRFVVCEAPDDPQGFAAPAACGSAFAFDLAPSLIGAANGDAASVQRVSDYFRTAPPGMSVFASNHDAFAGPRPWNQLGGDLKRLKMLAAAYLLLPGRPFIYYGEEIGMAGAASLSGDAALRTPMSWTGDTTNAGFTSGTPYRALSANVATQNAAAQAADPSSLLAFYTSMLAMRNGRPSIALGSYDAPFVANGTVMGFQRTLGTERTLVLLNFGTVDTAVTVSSLPPGAMLTAAYPAGGAGAAASAGGVAQLTVPAQSVLVFAVGP